MSMKKSLFAKLLIVILCLSLVLCGCSGAAGNGDDKDGEGNKISNDDGDKGGNKKPSGKVETAIGDTLSAIFGGQADAGVLEDALESGKVTITVGDYVENVLYIDTNNFNMADELKLNIEGVELEAELYVNEDELVIAVPDILDDAYGVSFDTLATDLEDSLIWELLGMDYEDFIAELGTSMEDLTALMDQMDKMDPTMNDLEGALEDIFAKVESSTKEGTATVNGKEVEAIIVTYSVTSDDIQEMIEILLDWFEGYANEMGDFVGMVEDAYGVEDMTAALDEVKDGLDEFFAENTIDVELVVNINAKTGYIMTVAGKLVGDIEDEEGIINLDINLGEDASKSTEYTMTLSATAEGETMDVASIVLEREVDGSETAYDLTISAGGMEVLTASFEYDSDSYEYSLSMEVEGEEFAVDGTYKLTDKEFAFSIGSIDMAGEKMDLDVAITIEEVSASKIPDAPRYTNILTMSEDEWTDLLTTLSTFFG